MFYYSLLKAYNISHDEESDLSEYIEKIFTESSSQNSEDTKLNELKSVLPKLLALIKSKINEQGNDKISLQFVNNLFLSLINDQEQITMLQNFINDINDKFPDKKIDFQTFEDQYKKTAKAQIKSIALNEKIQRDLEAAQKLTDDNKFTKPKFIPQHQEGQSLNKVMFSGLFIAAGITALIFASSILSITGIIGLILLTIGAPILTAQIYINSKNFIEHRKFLEENKYDYMTTQKFISPTKSFYLEEFEFSKDIRKAPNVKLADDLINDSNKNTTQAIKSYEKVKSKLGVNISSEQSKSK